MNTPAESSLSLELSRRFDAPPVRVFDAWLRKKVGRLPPRAKTLQRNAHRTARRRLERSGGVVR
jgi:hypothetical protein